MGEGAKGGASMIDELLQLIAATLGHLVTQYGSRRSVEFRAVDTPTSTVAVIGGKLVAAGRRNEHLKFRLNQLFDFSHASPSMFPVLGSRDHSAYRLMGSPSPLILPSQ